jgi:hypothetical protein
VEKPSASQLCIDLESLIIFYFINLRSLIIIVLATVASLFETDSAKLSKVLTSRSITTGTGNKTSAINIPLDLVGV